MPRERLSAWICAVSLGVAAWPAGAAVLDVNNYQAYFPRSGTGASSTSDRGSAEFIHAFQTWTVGVTGQLTGIDIFGHLDGEDGDYELAVFRGGDPQAPGAFDDANLLGEVVRSFQASRPNQPAYAIGFDLSALGIFATAGEQLTFRMRVEPCRAGGCSRQFVTFYNGDPAGTTNGYGGGQLYRSLNGATPETTPFDANFRTFMAPAAAPAPEPATWATLLFGFGAMGAVLRRRPPVTSP